ncbi:hypothetical protein JDV02_004396 [Purpureocillium takamizusanense]|uniref:Protein NO VEIN C-terminal domain-containing protein n=1 Tax=Purpureocillium takamizusanense TaxID=2060973 RepID=A0A9Q8QEG1_9HYPO|nr:uncharacterized protein JDV02_004396 [Purpureocillium takamizusanense]UNI18105.1 hypothetical protein JDV02_004396 [Purpureocillium takamizusanense]
MATVEEAKAIVQRLTALYGMLDKKMMDDIANWNPQYRQSIDEAWLTLETAASKSIKTLAKQIYGSGARFVFELLQNADDNKFKIAEAQNAPRFVSFKMFQDYVVIDCNEDGFNEKDLEAICAVGKSTKTASGSGYIGNKGIGFKSVFIAASTVYIQSGNYSFQFHHRKTDPGLGMVRPVWKEPTEQLPTPLTHTTLHLHNEGSSTEIEHLRSIIREQLEELQGTCLLFLQRLQCISVEIYGEDGKMQKSTRFTKREVDTYRVSVETTTSIAGSKESTESQIYHITKKIATGVGEGTNREVADSAKGETIVSTAEIVLAFPLTENSRPMVYQKQYVFAFLPIRKLDYRFLIHSDFDTNSSREDVITTSKRNLNLLEWIAKTFVEAVLQFCEDSRLCYVWPSFLPSLEEESSTSAFWSRLNNKIAEEIKATPVLRSRRRIDLRRIREVSILSDDARLADGTPVLETADDLFLSPEYSHSMTRILKPYGLKLLNFFMFVDMVENDIHASDSKMRGRDTTEEWHTVVAKLLLRILANPDLWERLKRLDLIPLRDGNWVSSLSSTVYFPEANGVMIPEDVDMNILEPRATSNQDRKALFKSLSVNEASIRMIRDSILQKFTSLTQGPRLIRSFDAHLRFLYQTSQPRSNHATRGSNEIFGKVILIRENNSRVWPHTIRHGKIGFTNQLVPEKFLGMLEFLWKAEGQRIRDSANLQQMMGNLPARGLCGANFEVKLRDTWLPPERLTSLAKQYMEHPDQFPFLRFERSEDTSNVLGVKWDFMRKYFGVGAEDSVHFLLRLLHHIQKSCPSSPSILQTQCILDLYQAINAKLTTATKASKESASQAVRTFFSQSGVLIPDNNNTSWSKSPDCLWRAPPDMTTKYSLRSLYARTLGEEQLANIENLFCRTVLMPAASSDHLIAELQNLRLIDCTDFTRIKRLYEYLDSLGTGPQQRLAFNDKALIYAQKHNQWSWYKTTDCLWSSTTSIRGKVTLDADYEELKTFFVKTVGVRLLTLQLIYDELRQPKPERDVADLRILITSLSSLLATEKGTSLDPKPIREADVFPVSYCNGTTTLRSAAIDFAIGDRDYLSDKFKDKIALLDYDLEDVHRLKPLFDWLNLTDRYLSYCVKEFTSVPENSGQRITNGPRSLRHKAYHILRIAATFRTTRYQISSSGLYETLSSMTVKATDGIFTSFLIQQNNKTTVVEEAAGNEHIDETPEGLVIYVPRQKTSQELCFSTVLPRKFAEWLMRDPTTNNTDDVDDDAVKALTAVFTCGRFALDEILDRLGIIQLSIHNTDPEDSETEHDDSRDVAQEDVENDVDRQQGRQSTDGLEQSRRLREDHPEILRPHPLLGTISGPDSPVGESHTETLVETTTHQSHMSHHTQPSRPYRPTMRLHSPQFFGHDRPSSIEQTDPDLTINERNSIADDTRYSELLNRVVAAAQRASFPSQGHFDLRSLRETLPTYTTPSEVISFDGLEVRPTFRSSSQFERDKKVGAAGELYVFELLKRLELPGWSHNNWQSRIRTYAKALPEYADMQAWTASETSDLVYDDIEGHFTDMLIGCGHLEESEWRGARPKYFLEVKTTTGPLETPFYVSGKQYRLMEQKHHAEHRSELYIILRVFCLNATAIEMCVYIDPWQLKEDGALRFDSQPWAVTPGEQSVYRR